MSQNSRVDAILLAAGEGSRMGGGKLLRTWKGTSLIGHAVSILGMTSNISSLTIVLGYEAETVQQICIKELAKAKENREWNHNLSISCIINLDWKKGMSTSLQAGISHLTRHVKRATAYGAMFLLADQPLLQAKTIDVLASAYVKSQYEDSPCLATVPLFQEKRGNPVILSDKLFPEIMRVQGDIGARNIIKKMGNMLLEVPVEDSGVAYDVDTPDAYNQLLTLE